MKTNLAARPALELRQVDDRDLRRQVMLWRIQALRGDPRAHRIARMLEIEELRRLQPDAVTIWPFLPVPAPRPWWRFW